MSGNYRSEDAVPGDTSERGDSTQRMAWLNACPTAGSVLRRQLRYLPDNTVVGTSCAAPRRMLWQGRSLHAAVLFGFDVAPGHRSLGPALLLMADMTEAAGKRFDLVFSFPTKQAVAMGRRAGHQPMADLVRLARVLRHRSYLARRLPKPAAILAGWCIDRTRMLALYLQLPIAPRYRTSWADTAPDAFDSLWSASRHEGPLVRVHDVAMARWRFDASPFARYRYLLLHGKEQELQAWFACRPEGHVLHVDDAWSRRGTDGVSRACVLHLLKAAWRGGFDSVSFCLAATDSARDSWQRAGFRRRDSRPVLGRWVNGECGVPEQVYLTAADEDQ